MTSASQANFSVKFMTHSLLAKAWEQEVFSCTYKFGITGHVGATSTQPYPLKLLCLLFWITFTLRTSSRRRKIWNHPEQECLHTSKLSDGFHLNSTFRSSHISRAKLSLIFSNQRLVSPLRDPKPLLFHLQYLQPGRTASLTETLNLQKSLHLDVSSLLLWLHSDSVTFSGQNQVLLAYKDTLSVASRGEQKHQYQANHGEFAA